MSSSKTSSKTSSKKPEKKMSSKLTSKSLTGLERDIQVINISDFNWDNVIPTPPKQMEMKDGSGKYYNVYFNYKYDDKSYGPIIISLGKHFCWGIREDDKKANNYKSCIVMTSENINDTKQPEDWEQKEVEFFSKWKEYITNYLIENKKIIGKASKTNSVLEDNTPSLLHYKKENDEIIPNKSPSLYSAVYYDENNDDRSSHFYGPGDKKMNPLKLSDSFHITPNIRFERLFIGNVISFKTSIYDAVVVPRNKNVRKRLAPKNNIKLESDDDDDNVDDDDVPESDDDEEPESDDEI